MKYHIRTFASFCWKMMMIPVGVKKVRCLLIFVLKSFTGIYGRFSRLLTSGSRSMVVFKVTSKAGSAWNFTFFHIRAEIVSWKQQVIIFTLMISFLVTADFIFFPSRSKLCSPKKISPEMHSLLMESAPLSVNVLKFGFRRGIFRCSTPPDLRMLQKDLKNFVSWSWIRYWRPSENLQPSIVSITHDLRFLIRLAGISNILLQGRLTGLIEKLNW